jgi:hypothetical protein
MFNKKGIDLALNAVVYSVLGVISLFIIVKSALPFLNTYDNYDIAKANAQSIVDFINYFEVDNKEYAGSTDCFNILKLKNLEQFQYDDPDLYYYIIDSEGVYILKENEHEKISGNIDYKNNALNFIPFKKKNNLYFDDTDTTDLNWLADIIFQKDTIDFNVKELGSSKTSNKFFLLQPVIPSTSEKIIYFSDASSNYYRVYLTDNEIDISKYVKFFLDYYPSPLRLVDYLFGTSLNEESVDAVSKIFKRDDLYALSEGTYLIQTNEYTIKKNNKKLKRGFFIINSKYTLPSIRGELCKVKYFNSQNKYYFYTIAPIKLIDYNNVDVFFEPLTIDGKKIEFQWRGKPVCIDSKSKSEFNCNDMLKLYPEGNNSYGTFINAITEKLKEESSTSTNSSSLELAYLKKIPDFEKQKRKVFFSDVFDFDNRLSFFSSEIDSNNEIANLNGFDMTKIINDKFNGLKSKESNLLFLRNNKLFFYVNQKNDKYNYYSFNVQFLRKKITYNDGEERIDIYYNGSIIPYEKKDFYEKERGLCRGFCSIFSDGSYFKLSIPNIYDDFSGEYKDIEIALSKNQIYNIPDFDSEYDLTHDIAAEMFGEKNGNIIVIKKDSELLKKEDNTNE